MPDRVRIFETTSELQLRNNTYASNATALERRTPVGTARHSDGADLVVYFGAREALSCGARYRELRAMFPAAHILGCSTGGQIRDVDVSDDEIAALALRFAATRLKLVCEEVTRSGAIARLAARRSGAP